MKNFKQLSAILWFACLFCLSANVHAGSVSGRVWNDLNANGIQEAGEPGISNVWVLLQDVNGNQLTGSLSNATGTYSLPNVANGTYILKFANPGNGFNFTRFDQGDDNADSDADQWGLVHFTIAGNQNLVFDAGLTTIALGCFTPVTIQIAKVNCNDNGTPCNAADDTFTFELTATGGTGPWGWDLPSMGILMYPYGTPRVFGPYPVSVGVVSLTIADHDNMDCMASVTVTAPNCAPPAGVLTLTCAADETVYTDPGKETWTVAPKQPTASSTCPVGTVTITQIGGPAAGSKVGPGIYTFTFKAVDDCCNERTCTSRVTVAKPCDTYVQGPTIVDLLDVMVDAKKNKTYCMRVTNTGNNPMEYVAFSLPNGITAKAPANNAIYTAPSGRQYVVRNPNFSPFYSIRFKAAPGTPGLVNGQSDIFKYTLQPQANPWNIHAIVRLTPKIFHEWYLSTAKCMPATTPNSPSTVGDATDGNDLPVIESRTGFAADGFTAFPNPAADLLNVDISQWNGQTFSLQFINAQGKLVREYQTIANESYFQMDLQDIPSGVYFLRGTAENGEAETLRVIVRK